MSRKNNSMKSAIGVSKEVLFALLEAIEDFGGEEEDIRRLLGDPKIKHDIVLRLLMGNPYLVDLNIDSIGGLLAAGKYRDSFISPLINDKNFVVGLLGPRLVWLMNFNDRFIVIDQILQKLDDWGFRPARMAELLALGAQQPQLQTQSWIVSLGDSQDKRFGCLDHNGTYRGVRLVSVKDVANVRCYKFAVVAK